jgi:hypothetical protein
MRRCLEWLNPIDFREAGGELVIVDNGSTDETHRVCEAFAHSAAFAAAVALEPTPGLGRARNAGIAHAQGELLAFTDDDCYPAPDFLRAALAAFDDRPIDYCGGRVLLYDERDARYTILDRREPRKVPPGGFRRPGTLLGSNMVFRRRVVEAIGGFDPELGPGTPFRGDDADYLARASLAGMKGAYVPEIVVFHHHGRRVQKGLAPLRRADDFARGAFYAKFVFLGYGKFAREWAGHAWRGLRRGDLRPFVRELHGAAAYVWSRRFRMPPLRMDVWTGFSNTGPEAIR